MSHYLILDLSVRGGSTSTPFHLTDSLEVYCMVCFQIKVKSSDEVTEPEESVRLVNGTSLCSGRLEVKSDQSDRSNQRWSSVCEADFDQQDAEVVCRELGCGAPSVLQGALYKEEEAPVWTRDFQCGGHESALLDCRSSDSTRTTCSPGKAVGLTCSEPFRVAGGDSHCAGELQVKQGDWRPVVGSDWTLREAAVLCRDLDCGSAVSVGERKKLSSRPVWRIRSECIQPGSAVRDCVTSGVSIKVLDLICSESVRLVNGTSLCSGRLEVKSDQSDRSNQRWSSVCEADFDQQDAEVVCRELGCGAPSVLQGALYGEEEAPVWTRDFQCGGHESALLDCRSSDSTRTTCSPGKAVGLTCSEPHGVRLVGGDSRCAESVRLVNGTSLCSGRLEVKSDQSDRSNQRWSSVCEADFDQQDAEVVCRELGCGAPSVLQGALYKEEEAPVWTRDFQCGGHESALLDCRSSDSTRTTCSPGKAVGLTCSEPVRLVGEDSRCAAQRVCVHRPTAHLCVLHGVSEAKHQGFQVSTGSTFAISCSVQPQYPGGSFQLDFTSSKAANSYTQPAVNHSAHFLFPAAEPAHQGSYTCVYQVDNSSCTFSSESCHLSVTVSDPTVLIKVVVLPLTLLLMNSALYFYCKGYRGQNPGRRQDLELVNYHLGVSEEDRAP
ncbi:hypothetical protein Q5P01_024053 [Channa striata]|uniref:SRCR domain-containing protein n=1 Tax=Channa striata TaxID=64152 RepID=A0AA88IQB2_CHASR|nr:hypothetical protein Q5P01_024053 [Channa striata]